VSAIDDDHFEGPFGRQLSLGALKIASTSRGDGRLVHLETADLFCVRIGNTALSRVGGPSACTSNGMHSRFQGDITLRRDELALLRCAVSESEPTSLVTVGP
jgi:hypothetical protein